MADNRYEEAVDIVARRILANGARREFEDRVFLKEAYEVDDATLDEVEQRAAQIIGSIDPAPDEFSGGHGFLRARVDAT